MGEFALMECVPPLLVADHERSPTKKTLIFGTNRFSRHGAPATSCDICEPIS
jgi:hypothetical protein